VNDATLPDGLQQWLSACSDFDREPSKAHRLRAAIRRRVFPELRPPLEYCGVSDSILLELILRRPSLLDRQTFWPDCPDMWKHDAGRHRQLTLYATYLSLASKRLEAGSGPLFLGMVIGHELGYLEGLEERNTSVEDSHLVTRRSDQPIAVGNTESACVPETISSPRQERSLRVTSAVLNMALPRKYREFLIGDLIEEYQTELLQERSKARAKLWLLKQSLGIVCSFILVRLLNVLGMIRRFASY
jgi:hypothetical protein